MKYFDYSAEDFANDSFFIRWVRRPDEESNWFWTSFMNENPECRVEIERARQMILSLDFEAHTIETEELNRMRNGLLMSLYADKEEKKEKKSRHLFPVSKQVRFMLRAAAIMIPVVCAGLYLLLQQKDLTPLATGALPSNAVEQRINPSGQKSVLFLSDGTKVWLNAASKLTYAREFGTEGTRDVYLEGEAFFDVVHDRERPFIVHTSSIAVKVLGTSFNVKSYSEEETVETTLVDGKVQIVQSDENGRQAAAIDLKPNQRAVFDKVSGVMNVKEVQALNSGLWKEDRLIFDEEPIDNVILQLERWYNVKIHVKKRGQLNCKLTARIGKESLQEVLKLIEATHDIRYTIVGQEVFIEGVLCAEGG